MRVPKEPRRIRDLIELAEEEWQVKAFRKLQQRLLKETRREVSFAGENEIEVFPANIEPEAFAEKLTGIADKVLSDVSDELRMASLWTIYDEVSGYIGAMDRKDLNRLIRYEDLPDYFTD